MNILEQIKRQMGISSPPSNSPSVRPEVSALRDALDAGQRAKRSEDYPLALEALNEAMRLAISSGDTNALAITALNQADVYIAQKRWLEAESLLQKTYQTAQEARQRPQMAYILSAIGALSQAQGDWADAQQSYEKALETARSSRAPGAEGRAMGYLADVYLHDSNASYAIHLLREALPRLNMTGDIELSSYFVGRLGEALISAGQAIEGQQLLERALRLAKQLGYRQEQRRWGLIMGQRAMSEGRMENAYNQFEEALSYFSRDQQDEKYIQALSQMSRVCLSLHKQDEALRYARLACELSITLGSESLTAQTRAALGIVYLGTHNTQAAIPELEAAAEIYTHPTVQNPSSELDTLRNLAAAYAENGQDDKAIETYRRTIQRADSRDDKLQVAQTYRDLGLYYAQRQKMRQAIQEWQNALNLYLANNQNGQAARLYCDIAAGRKYLGFGQRAMKDYEEASMLLSSLSEDRETRGLVLANTAIAYADQGDTESAESFFNEAISIARQLHQTTAEATRRGNYGWYLLAIGRPQQAISTLEYALSQSREQKLDLQTAIQTDNLGLAYDAQSSYEKALDYHQQALTLIEPLRNRHWESIIKINQANTLLSLRNADAAQPLLNTALTQGRADEDVEVIVRSLTGLGRLALQRSTPESATTLLDEATGLARRADMRRLLAEALSVYSEQQAKVNQRERSEALWDEAQKLYNVLRLSQSKLRPAWLETAS